MPIGEVGEIRSEKRRFRTYGHTEGEYELGTLFVLENRSDPNSRVIPIDFARFPAQEAKGPPVFLLPGGPGNTFIDRRDSLWLSKPPPYLGALREGCDVVLVNQRGYNHRHHVLWGWFNEPAPAPDATVDDFVEVAKKTAAAITNHQAKTGQADLRGYTILECADDVNDLRTALGYKKIVLMGQSFGSQWSFAVMRRHPTIVERAILSGVEPLNHSFDMPSHAWAAAKRIWPSIEADPRFAPYLPSGGMAEAAEAVIAKLEEKPISVTAKGKMGWGKPNVVRVLGPDDFPWDNPVAILELYHGHLNRWTTPRRGLYGYGPLIYHLIDSSTGVTAHRGEQLWNDPAVRYVSREGFASMIATADIWPSPDVGDAFRRPTQCEIPVVFVHGDWDMYTPIENTREVAPYFPNGHVLEIRQGGHDPLRSMKGEHPEVFAALIQFAHTGSSDNLPNVIEFKPSKRFDPPTFAVQSKN